MLKKGDVIEDADDEVRTSESQDSVTVTLCTEKSSSGVSKYIALPSYEQRSVGGGQEVDSQRDIYRRVPAEP
jgi:hypothetical protein